MPSWIQFPGIAAECPPLHRRTVLISELKKPASYARILKYAKWHSLIPNEHNAPILCMRPPFCSFCVEFLPTVLCAAGCLMLRIQGEDFWVPNSLYYDTFIPAAGILSDFVFSYSLFNLRTKEWTQIRNHTQVFLFKKR